MQQKSETWRTSERIESKLRVFEGRCLRGILKIRCEDSNTNKEVAALSGNDCIIAEIKQRIWGQDMKKYYYLWGETGSQVVLV